jgi:hypothetical protein
LPEADFAYKKTRSPKVTQACTTAKSGLSNNLFRAEYLTKKRVFFP